MVSFSFSLYALSSCLVTASVILNAFSTKQQFYSTVIFLVKSKFSLLVLFNFAFVLFFLLAKLTRRIFFGQLRRSEVELLWENTGYTITETCLALTIFREELNLNTYLLFSCLLFFKGFHWLSKARVEHLEQDIERYRNWTSQIRIASFISLLFLVDILISSISANLILESGPSVQLLFGFEFLLLSLAAFSILTKYALITIDAQLITGRWYNKSLYEMYIRLGLAVIHFGVYTAFFCIVFTFYGIPIHLMRSLYLSFHTMQQRLKHFIQFQRVSLRLDSRFADASEEELSQTDRICVICREEMHLQQENTNAETRIKKLSCGHIFHFYCLRNWFERQLKCPTCRADIDTSPLSAPTPAANVNNVEQQEPQDHQANNVVNNANRDEALPNRNRVEPLEEIRNNLVAQQREVRRLEEENAEVLRDVEEINRRHNVAENRNPDVTSGSGNEPPTEQQSSPRTNPTFSSVNTQLRNQVTLLKLQLQLYAAQMAAAEAAKEASLSLVEVANARTQDALPEVDRSS